MMKTKRIKLLALITAVMMVMCTVPVFALAGSQNVVTITDSSLDEETGVITVEGTVTCEGEPVSAEVTILATRQDSELEAKDMAEVGEGTIVYIDQITATAEGEFSFSFVSGMGVSGNYITVFVGGENYTVTDDTVLNFEAPVAKAGTIEAIGEKTEFLLGTDDVKFAVNAEGAGEGWTDTINSSLAVYEGIEVVSEATATYNSVAGTIEVTGISLAEDFERELTLKILGNGVYGDASIDFTVISPVQKVIDQLPKSVSVTHGDTNATVDFPASFTDYGTTITKYFATSATNSSKVSDYVATLTRGAQGSDPKEYFLYVKVEKTNFKTYEKTYSFKVRSLGDDGPTVNSVVIDKAGAFADKVAGRSMIAVEIKEGDIDVATEALYIGENKLYWAPQRGKFVGFVPTESFADTNAIESAVKVQSEASEVVYYGKVSATSSTAALNLTDVARYLAIRSGGVTPTDAQLLAGDVLGTGTMSLTHVARILNSRSTGADFAIVSK